MCQRPWPDTEDRIPVDARNKTGTMTSAARSVIAIWPTRGRVIHTAHWAASENPHPVGLNVSRRTRRRSPHPFGKRSSDNADADAPDGKADRPNVWVGPLPHRCPVDRFGVFGSVGGVVVVAQGPSRGLQPAVSDAHVTIEDRQIAARLGGTHGSCREMGHRASRPLWTHRQ